MNEPPHNPPPAAQTSRSWVSVLSLTAIAVCAALAVSQVARITEPQIERNRQIQATRMINAVLPGVSYDNEPGLDYQEFTDAELLGSSEPMRVYTARREGRPVAHAITAVAPNGYVGPIRLLIGVSTDGTVLAVRTLEHRETPGLGDQIERQRSAWIAGFDGLTSQDAGQANWSLQTDGGRFDQLSGATVTSRAVVRAVGRALLFSRASGDELASVELVTKPDK